MNIGVLLRHAEAFGYTVVACEGTPPLNARQVIRSSTGSGLRKPFYRAVMPVGDLVRDLRALGVLTISTSAHAATSVTDIPWRSPHIILVGNETHGLDPEVRQAAEIDAVIPMVPGGAHSINVAVASSIMMFEGMKNSH
jgi:TrmH family RNA methyltransferase